MVCNADTTEFCNELWIRYQIGMACSQSSFFALYARLHTHDQAQRPGHVSLGFQRPGGATVTRFADLYGTSPHCEQKNSFMHTKTAALKHQSKSPQCFPQTHVPRGRSRDAIVQRYTYPDLWTRAMMQEITVRNCSSSSCCIHDKLLPTQ